MKHLAHRCGRRSSRAIVPAALLIACGPEREGIVQPAGPGELVIEIDGKAISVEVSMEARSFDSTQALMDWLRKLLPVEPLMDGDKTIGLTLDTHGKILGTLTLDGDELSTNFPVIAMIGGLSGQVEIAGVKECVDIDQVCNDDLANYFSIDVEVSMPLGDGEQELAIGQTRSLLSRRFTQCTGPSAEPFCIEGRSERTVVNLLFVKSTEHYTYTKITRGGDYNSQAAIYGGWMRSAPDDSVSVSQRSNPIREARGPNAYVEFTRHSWTLGVDSFETRVFQNCNWHQGHRRLLGPIRFGTEWTRSHRAGLLPCAPLTLPPLAPEYPPELVLSCNGDLGNPVIRCSVSGISQTSSIRWARSGVAQPQWNGQTSIAFACQPSFSYSVTIFEAGRSETALAPCRASSR